MIMIWYQRRIILYIFITCLVRAYELQSTYEFQNTKNSSRIINKIYFRIGTIHVFEMYVCIFVVAGTHIVYGINIIKNNAILANGIQICLPSNTNYIICTYYTYSRLQNLHEFLIIFNFSCDIFEYISRFGGTCNVVFFCAFSNFGTTNIDFIKNSRLMSFD